MFLAREFYPSSKKQTSASCGKASEPAAMRRIIISYRLFIPKPFSKKTWL